MSEVNVKSRFYPSAKHNGHGDAESHCDASNMDSESAADKRPDPIQEFRQSFKALGAALTQFGQARVDGMRISARNTALTVALAILGAFCAAAFTVVCLVLLLMGLAGGVARIFNTANWVGYLIVGGFFIVTIAIIAVLTVRRIKKQWLEQLRDKYAGTTEIQSKQ